MEALRAHPGACVAPVCQGKSLVTAGEKPGSALLPLAQLRPHLVDGTLVFLGLDQEAPVFGAACPAGDAERVAALAGDSHGQVSCLHAVLLSVLAALTLMSWLACGASCMQEMRACMHVKTEERGSRGVRHTLYRDPLSGAMGGPEKGGAQAGRRRCRAAGSGAGPGAVEPGQRV